MVAYIAASLAIISFTFGFPRLSPIKASDECWGRKIQLGNVKSLHDGLLQSADDHAVVCEVIGGKNNILICEQVFDSF